MSEMPWRMRMRSRKVDAWLRRAMKSTPRAVLTLSYPTDKEITMQNHYKQRRMKLR